MSAQQTPSPSSHAEWVQGMMNKLDYIERYCEVVGRPVIESWMRSICTIFWEAAKQDTPIPSLLMFRFEEVCFKLTGRILDYLR